MKKVYFQPMGKKKKKISAVALVRIQSIKTFSKCSSTSSWPFLTHEYCVTLSIIFWNQKEMPLGCQ